MKVDVKNDFHTVFLFDKFSHPEVSNIFAKYLPFLKKIANGDK